jgi:penicillin amidase
MCIVAGNRGIINATNADHGPSWKMIVDFGDMKGYCVYPGGESGNPGSPFYDDMIDTWAKGEYYTAHFSKAILTS